MEEKILSDHIKKKKTLVSPMNHQLNITEANYGREVVPEIIWIALICEMYGLRRTVEIVEKLTDGLLAVRTDKRIVNCCLMSSYEGLSTEKKQMFLKNQNVKQVLEDIRVALRGFKECYPDAPINFMHTKQRGSKTAFINRIKNILMRLLDPLSTQSIYALSCIFYSQGYSGHLHGNITINLNDIVDYPNTDKSQYAAAVLRASTKAFIKIMSEETQQMWAKYFWAKNYELEPCKIINLIDIEP